MANRTHEELKDLLNTVPGVKEHLNKHSVIMGKKILKRRLELGLTQAKVIELIRRNGGTITQSTLSKIEAGNDGVQARTYDQVFDALGGLVDIQPTFKEPPKRRVLANQF